MSIKKYFLLAMSSLVIVIGIYLLGFYPVSELTYKWKVGEVNSYHYKFSAEGIGKSLKSMSNPGASSRKMDTSVVTKFVGKLEITTLAIDENDKRIELLYKIIPEVFEIKVGSVSAPKIPDYIEVIVVLDELGRVINFEMPESIYTMLNSTLAEFISLIELPLQEQKVISWKGIEKDFSDVIPVELSRLWRLPLIGLQPIAKTYFNSPKGNAHSGAMIYEIDLDEGLLKNISGIRFSEYYITGNVVSQTQTQFSLQHIQTSNPSSLPVTVTNFNNIKTIKDNLQGVYLVRQARIQSKKNVLGNHTLDSLAVLMSQIDLTRREARTPLMQKLYALMWLHPETVLVLGGWLDQYDAGEPEFRMIVALLSGLGTHEAQSILVGVMQASENESGVLQILPHMGLLARPTLASENYVRSLKVSSADKMVKNMADLSLGAMAKNIYSSSPERSSRILEDKKSDLSSVNNNSELKYQLKVIGNMGLPEQYDVIKPYLTSDSSEIRSQAVDSLRFVSTKEAAHALIESMSDENVGVRIAAVGALGYRTASDNLINAYEESLYSEKKVSVVRMILSNIGGISQQDPRRNTLLKEYLAQCGITALCNQAKSLL